MAFATFRDPVGTRFCDWIDGSVRHATETLQFREIRRGVQALLRSTVRVTEGAGKRAALACYFNPLEFAAAHFAAREVLARGAPSPPRRVVDLACGFGGAGAGIATAFDEAPPVFGVERARAMHDELARTWRTFGVDGRIAAAAPRAIGRGDVVCVAWRPGSPVGDAGAALLARAAAFTRRGATVLSLEPRAFADDARHARWIERFGGDGAVVRAFRPSFDRPPFIRQMDKAARLDHQRLSCRLILAGGVRAE